MRRGQNAIVTGASRGIGLATVEKLASEGVNIWACMHHENHEICNRFKVLEEENDIWIHPVLFDLGDEEQVIDNIKNILSEKKDIDLLVNNAGVPYGGLMAMTPIRKMHEVFQINYFSQILLIQMISKRMMRQRSGVIVNLASAGGIEHSPGYLAYGGSKNAIIWATKTIAKELAPYGIRVNAVAPGLTATDMGEYKNEGEREKTLNRTPMGRMAQPDEIADAILFLGSDAASYITGDILQVDGGRV